MGVNAYSPLRRTTRPHETPNYGLGKSKFEIDYSVVTYFSPGILALIRTKQ